MTMNYVGGTKVLRTGTDLNGVTVTVEHALQRSMDHAVGVVATFAAGAPTYSLAYRLYWEASGTKRYSASTTVTAAGTAFVTNVVQAFPLALTGCDGIELTLIGAGAATATYDLFFWTGEA